MRRGNLVELLESCFINHPNPVQAQHEKKSIVEDELFNLFQRLDLRLQSRLQRTTYLKMEMLD